MKTYVLACADCEYVFEGNGVEDCPRCESDDTEIVTIEEASE